MDELKDLPGLGEKSAMQLIENVKQASDTTLPRLLFAIGIPTVGEETAHDLANHFKTLEALQQASIEDVVAILGIGEVVAENIVAWLSAPRNKKLLSELKKHLRVSSVSPQASTTLGGNSFVFTGTLLQLDRNEAKERVRALGGEISSSVSTKTSYVVAGKDPGSKYEQAKRLGVEILDENAFMELIS